MEEADKDWMMIRMVGGCVFLLALAHPSSSGQRSVKRLCGCCVVLFLLSYTYKALLAEMCQICNFKGVSHFEAKF